MQNIIYSTLVQLNTQKLITKMNTAFNQCFGQHIHAFFVEIFDSLVFKLT